MVNIIVNDPVVIDFRICEINSLYIGNNIIVNPFNDITFGAILVEEGELIRFKNDTDSISGTLFRKNGKFRGLIYYGNSLIEIRPLFSNKHIILLIDHSLRLTDECNTDDKASFLSETLELDEAFGSNTISNYSECNIRVLVAYTPAASVTRGGGQAINDDIEWAIHLSNQSYSNSNINLRIELAISVLTDYTESGSWNTDVSRFFNSNDGHMDELHILRNVYHADILALVLDNDTYCGQATSILANANNAFFVISAYGKCLTSNFSFAHELGHLQGCRHNPEVDPSNSPFKYGHGFCYSYGNWRTIMSYNSGCSNRLQFWSNPFIFFNGVGMGTEEFHNNARVLRDTEDLVKEFRTTPENYYIPDEEISEFNISDFLAHEKLHTSDYFVTENNSHVTFRAGQEVILNPGFHAQYGSVFHAHIDKCEYYLQYLSKMSYEEDRWSNKYLINESENSIRIFPNPNDGIFFIEGLQVDSQIFIYDLNGHLIYKENTTGPSHIVQLNWILTGTYSVKILSKENTYYKQIIINK